MSDHHRKYYKQAASRHTTRSMQAVSMQLLLQNEHIAAAPSKLSRTTAVDLSETEYSQSSLSEFPYIFDYAGKGPNLWNYLHRIKLDGLLQGSIVSAAASFTKAVTKAVNSELIQMACSRLVVSLEPKLQPGMTRIRWKCVSMSLVLDGAFKGRIANLLLCLALWKQPLRRLH